MEVQVIYFKEKELENTLRLVLIPKDSRDKKLLKRTENSENPMKIKQAGSATIDKEGNRKLIITMIIGDNE